MFLFRFDFSKILLHLDIKDFPHENIGIKNNKRVRRIRSNREIKLVVFELMQTKNEEKVKIIHVWPSSSNLSIFIDVTTSPYLLLTCTDY